MRWIVSAAVASALAGVAYSTPLAGNAPAAVDDFAIVESSFGPVSIPLLDNDSDPDGDALSIVGLSGAGSEFAQIDGGGLSFSGPDGFYALTYTVQDSEGLQSTASVQIMVFSFLPTCGLVECG